MYLFNLYPYIEKNAQFSFSPTYFFLKLCKKSFEFNKINAIEIDPQICVIIKLKNEPPT